MKNDVLNRLHNSDHIGKNLYNRVNDGYCGMERQECIDFVARCEICQRSVPLPNINGNIRPIYTSYPYERLHVDAIDLRRYAIYNNNMKWIFTFLESFTKFGWAFPAIDKNGESFSKILKQFFLQEGEWD